MAWKTVVTLSLSAAAAIVWPLWANVRPAAEVPLARRLKGLLVWLRATALLLACAWHIEFQKTARA